MKKLTMCLAVALLAAWSVAVPAQDDPAMDQVHAAAVSGNLQQAQQLMNQVLRTHPGSARAHFLAAELYARLGNGSLARQELATARQLEPGLPFAKPEAVRALENGLPPGQDTRSRTTADTDGASPWDVVLVVLAGVAVLWMSVWIALKRRGAATVAFPPYANSVIPPPGAPGCGPQGFGPGFGTPGAGAPDRGVGMGIAGAALPPGTGPAPLRRPGRRKSRR